MKRHQCKADRNSAKVKVLSCFFAFSLVFGLSAMPALAVQDTEGSDALAAQSEGSTKAASSADQGKASASEKEESKVSGSWNDSKNKTDATGNKSSADSTSSSKENSGSDSKKTDVLNPVEKFGAVLEGERQAAVENATGVSSQEYDELTTETPASEELDEKEAAFLLIAQSLNDQKSQFNSYAPSTPSTGASIMIKKSFDGSILTTESNKEPSYTAVFRVQAIQTDYDGNEVYEDPSNGAWYYKDSDGNFFSYGESFNVFPIKQDGSVVDREDRVIWEDGQGRLLRVGDDGVYDWNYNQVYVDLNKSIAFVDEKEKFIYEDEAGNIFSYVLNEDGYSVKTQLNVDAEGKTIPKEKVTGLKAVQIHKAHVDLGALKPVMVYPVDYSADHQWEYFSVNMASDQAATEIPDLPYPVKITVEEITYDGCGYTPCTSTNNPQSQTLTWPSYSPLVFEFSNTSSGGNTPNEGYVNRYTVNNGTLSASQISIEDQIKNAENSTTDD